MQTQCHQCHAPLPQGHAGACPKCGCDKKSIFASATNTMSLSDSVGWESRHEFYQKNPIVLTIVGIITIVSPFVGLYLKDKWGVIVGLALGIVSYVLGPYATKIIREIRKG